MSGLHTITNQNFVADAYASDSDGAVSAEMIVEDNGFGSDADDFDVPTGKKVKKGAKKTAKKTTSVKKTISVKKTTSSKKK